MELRLIFGCLRLQVEGGKGRLDILPQFYSAKGKRAGMQNRIIPNRQT
jgi:hypothetical protein